MDRDKLVELVPHYAANLILIFATIAVLRFLVGELNLLIELGIVVALVLIYPTIVRELGYAPSIWQK